jgi:hypothetical protein
MATRSASCIALLVALGGAGCSAAAPAQAGDAGDDAGADAPLTYLPGSDQPIGGPGVVTLDDAASSVDPAAAYAVSLTMNTFPVAPGGELYKCQDFANPFHGQPVDIVRYDLAMSRGSHHMLLFYSQGGTDGPVIDCPMGGLQIGPYTFGAQSPTVSAPYPDGIGAAIPSDMGFTVNAHYVNTGATPLQASVKVTMYVGAPGKVTQHAGVLQFVLTSISIPPTGQPFDVSGSCPLTQDLNILWADSHMHQRATHFIATSGATKLFETTSWSDPPSQTFSPPLALSATATVDWSCTYVNDTGSTLTFGESALSNAMCNFGASFYPVSDPSNPVVRCLK